MTTSNNNDWMDFDPLGLDNDDMSEEHLSDEKSHGDDTQASSTDINKPDNVNHQENYQEHMEHPKFDGDTSRANPNFRPLLPKPINKNKNNRQLIMDTETTGLDPNNGDRIIEVGIVEMVGRKFTGEKLHVYVNPQRGMDEEVIRVHGISEEFLKDMPTYDKVAQQIYDFMDGAEVIAHNAQFDMNFLIMEFNKVGLKNFADSVTVTDSLAIAKQQYPGQKNTLDALVKRLNVGKQDRTFHGALLDSEILAEVYLALTGGQVSLAIDDELSVDGSSAHQQFVEVAHLLLSDTAPTEAHEQWLDKMIEKFPTLKEVWRPETINIETCSETTKEKS